MMPALSPSALWCSFRPKAGDAWMLDPSDQLAARLARDGDHEPIDFQETDADFKIGWKGNYHIEGRAFVYADREAVTILGYARQNCSIGLNRKFQRCLARVKVQRNCWQGGGGRSPQTLDRSPRRFVKACRTRAFPSRYARSPELAIFGKSPRV
jgi:hypothetical protein